MIWYGWSTGWMGGTDKKVENKKVIKKIRKQKVNKYNKKTK